MEIKIYTFEQLTTALLYKILQHRHEVFAIDEQTIFHDCDDKDFDALHVVGFENDSIVAYLRILKKDNSDLLTFGRVSVRNRDRGNNYGLKIVDFAVKHITENLQKDSIIIASQAHVLDFYKKLGFTVCSDQYVIQGVQHADMVYEKNRSV